MCNFGSLCSSIVHFEFLVPFPLPCSLSPAPWFICWGSQEAELTLLELNLLLYMPTIQHDPQLSPSDSGCFWFIHLADCFDFCHLSKACTLLLKTSTVEAAQRQDYWFIRGGGGVLKSSAVLIELFFFFNLISWNTSERYFLSPFKLPT